MKSEAISEHIVVFSSTGDDPEGSEDIPEHEQAMRCGRVICTNYSLLYGQLDAEKLLPKLPEKDLIDENQLKEAKCFHQKFAKNAHVIRILLWYDRPSHGLLKFCDTLETTPGQEHLGRKLLKGISLSLTTELHDIVDVLELSNVISQITRISHQYVYTVQVKSQLSTLIYLKPLNCFNSCSEK